ncbi:hypothetical protein P9D39_16290 [Heyndrickxia oleronia]|uniref:Uncharacterized protein n=1 Tax=Heyndrickxia oleronia TaxID=38875 RepID=A0A8E2I7E6_9BACI|nr:hypothetical protein [Heyndrickxia oleronia]MEC1375851.1 hypothetical protein [Heyndrickxia oleronia]OOP67707.1 hypothetical protein BWZ43_14330 [Heyndrickxia oleronia]QQZ05568.1 hypothetical protein I5818_03470 [Heyndrickxia oleronia]
MNNEKNTKPIYDRRVKEILEGLSQNIPRDELAKKFGHKNYKTLDIYMRRRNFTWDSENQTYIPKLTKDVPIVEKVKPTSKAGMIIEMLKNPNFNIEYICAKVGFKDHRQIAEYMTSKGFVWSPDEGNYKKTYGMIENDKDIENDGMEIENILDEPITQKEISEADLNPPMDHMENNQPLRQDYIPLLKWLASNKEKISKLIDPTNTDTLPRYIIPGKANGKTIQLSEALQDMAVTFCNERNIKQRELFEVALIEFFRKYGYDYEVENLLQSF